MDWATMRCSAAWAAKRQERLQAALGEGTYRDLEVAILWGLGARAQDLQAVRGLGRSSLYEHLGHLLTAPPRGELATADGDPVPTAPTLEPALAARIVELLVGSRLEPAEIAQRLAEQDGTQLSVEAVTTYLTEAGLAGYAGSAFRDQALAEAELGTFTRYAAQLLQVPALQALGCDQVLPLLDVTRPTEQYSHTLRCTTILLALAAGKRRLYQTGELVPDEFAPILGTDRYPQRSDLHAYLDRIVARDQAEAVGGVPAAERAVAQFTQASQRALAQAGGPGVGQAVYLDAHVMALHTAKPTPQTKHGTWNRVVKALVKLRTVSATQPGRALTFTLEQGDMALVSQVEAAIERVEWTTGERVELVGVDRGALSQEVLAAFTDRDTGLVVWADDTPVLRQTVASVPRSAFMAGEYETVRRPDGKKVPRLKTRLADLPLVVINQRGYRCRTVVVEDVRTRQRAAFHAVGQPADRRSAQDLLAFLRGKQWVEEDFKQGRAWGADAFCGGEIQAQERRAQPPAAEVQVLIGQARHLKRRWQENLAEEGTAVAQWRAGQLRKRQLNDLRKGIRRRREQIAADWQAAEELIAWGRTGRVPPSQLRWVVDTRKMTILAQFQDFIRQARRDTLAQWGQSMEQVLIARAVAERGEVMNERERQDRAQAAREAVQRLPWGQLSVRLFEQGGWVRKDTKARVLHVTLKPFGPRLVQQACARLCEHLNSLTPVMHCEDGDYTLHYAYLPRAPG